MDGDVTHPPRPRRDRPSHALLQHDDVACFCVRTPAVEHELGGPVEDDENHVSLRVDVLSRAATRWPLEQSRVEIAGRGPTHGSTTTTRQQPGEQFLRDGALDRFEEHALLEPDVPLEQLAECGIRPVGAGANPLVLEQRPHELRRLDAHPGQKRKDNLLLLTKMRHQVESEELDEPFDLTTPKPLGVDEGVLVAVRQRHE